MKLSTIAFLSITLILSACSSDSTGVNNPPNNGGNNNGNNNGSLGSFEFVAKISRFGTPVPKPTNGVATAASDVFWEDSTGHEHSFLADAHGKVALLCIGGLWSRYSDPMFNTVDSLLKFYGQDSLYALRVFTNQMDSVRFLRDSITSNGWHGRFVYENNTQSLTNYQNVGGTGVPYTAIIDRSGHLATWRVGAYLVDTAARIFERLVDSVKKS